MAESISQNSVRKPPVLHSEGRWYVVNFDNLIFVEARGRYKFFYFNDKENPYKVDATMKSVEDDLAVYRNLVSVHRSFILNLKYVFSYDARCAYVVHNGKEHSIPITHNDMAKHFAEMFKA